MLRPRSRCLVALSLTLLVASCGDDEGNAAAAVDSAESEADAEATAPGTATTEPDQDEGPAEVAPEDQCGSPDATLESAADAPAARGTGLQSVERSVDPGAQPDFADDAPEFGEVAIAVVGPGGRSTGWCVLLAESSTQRSNGLMHVTDLAGYSGMLFVHDNETDQSFWMKNTVMPLSIVWFDDDGRFVSATDMEPCEADPCPSYPSEGPARFSLEVPQGDLTELGIDADTVLRVGGT